MSPAFGIDLDLIDAGHPVLDRVLHRDDVLGFLVQDVERRVHRGRLARARRPGHEDRAVGLRERRREPIVGVLEEAEVGEVQHRVALVEDADHDLLAVHGRERRDTHVELPGADLHRDPAVLRHALLRDVQICHDLEPGDQPALEVLGLRPHRLVEHAVDPEADAHVALPRLDVDVRRPFGDRLGHDRVDELDDGRVLEGGLEVELLTLATLRCLGGQLLDLGVQAGELLDRLLDVGGRRHHGLDLAARDRADVIERVDVGGVRHRDEELPVAFADREGSVPASERLRQEGGGGGVDLGVVEIDELQSDLLGERPDEIGLLDHAEVDQDPAERLRGLLVLRQGRVELFGRDQSELDQDLPELLRLPLHGGHRRSVRSRSSAGWVVQMQLPACFVILPRDLKQAGELFREEDPVDLRLFLLAPLGLWDVVGRRVGLRLRGVRRLLRGRRADLVRGWRSRPRRRRRRPRLGRSPAQARGSADGPACACSCVACPTEPRELRAGASRLGRPPAPARQTGGLARACRRARPAGRRHRPTAKAA